MPGRVGAGTEATSGLMRGSARRFHEVGELEEVERGLRAKAGAPRVSLAPSARSLMSWMTGGVSRG